MKIKKEVKEWVIEATRPDGRVEILENKMGGAEIPSAIWAQMVKATRDAGKGEIKQKEQNATIDVDVLCRRCGEKHSPKFWLKQGVGYYCNDCHTLLTAIGRGEQTAWDEASEERDYTPFSKAD